MAYVGWWPFNGNANDESGNGNNGTVNGAVLTPDRFGDMNNAYNFDGITNDIQVANNQILNFGFNPTFSITLWVYKPTANFGGIICKGEPANGFGWNGWNLIDEDFQLGYPCLNYNNIPIALSSWKHISIIINNGTITTFIDAIQNSQNYCPDITNSSISTLSNLYFGVDRDLNNFFSGKLDDIGIWNRALTDCEIQNLYNSSNPTNTTTITACDSYVWNGTTYTSSGVYTGTTTNCVTQALNLTINTNTSSSISQTALDSYTWLVNNQTYTTTGAYTAVIPNASGCDSTITLNLTMSFTGINDLSASKLSIYPNPTNGDFTITGLELVGSVSSLSLTDMNGKVVKVLDTKATKFSMGSIKPGVYFLNIRAGNKEEVLKIVKE